METTTTKLTTAVEVMAAFNAVANDAELNKNPESAELLKNLAQIFIHRPIGEIDGSIENITDAYQTAIGKMFTVYPDGSEEYKAVVAKRLTLVDEFVKAGNLDAAGAWLERGCNTYPPGSEEEKAMAAKQEQLRQLRSSQQLGAIQKIDIAGLRRVINQELTKLQVASVGH